MQGIPIYPQKTLQASNTFVQNTQGYIQGSVLDDPTSRMQQSAGKVLPGADYTLWGGMAITELVPAINGEQTNIVELASGMNTLTGFTVFNQSNNMVIAAGNPVQQSSESMSIGYYRMGSNARIAVQCDSSLVNSLVGNPINQQVSWDFTNQKLIAYNSGIGALPVYVLYVNTNSKIVSYNSETGQATYTTGAVAVIQLMDIGSSGGSGSGDVVGPSSATSNSLVKFTDGTGKVIGGTNAVFDSNGNLNFNTISLYGNCFTNETQPTLATNNITNASIGKYLFYSETSTLNLPDDLPDGAQFAILNAGGAPTITLSPQGASTITGTTIVNQSEIFLASYIAETREYLMQPLKPLYSFIQPNQLVCNPTAYAATPQGANWNDFLYAAASNVQGSMLYCDSSSWGVLAPGGVGSVLISNSSGANPAWSNLTVTGGSVSIGANDPGGQLNYTVLNTGTAANSDSAINIQATSNSGGSIGGSPFTSYQQINYQTVQTGIWSQGNGGDNNYHVSFGAFTANDILIISPTSATFKGKVNATVGNGFINPVGNGTTGIVGTATLSPSGTVTVTSSDCTTNALPQAWGITATGSIRTVNNSNGTFTITSSAGASDSGLTVGWVINNPNT